MKTIGITGSTGFIGLHLTNRLKLLSSKYRVVECPRTAFDNGEQLRTFVKECDVVVHLAALNRNIDSDQIYTTNMGLVERLVEAMEQADVTPRVIYSSSMQEQNGNGYGRSKRDGRLLLERWAEAHKASLVSLILPNIFGEFGKPEYNSFVSTFAYRLTHGEQPQIIVDRKVDLLYVANLCDYIVGVIENEQGEMIDCRRVPFDFQATVSEVLAVMTRMKEEYVDCGSIPDLSSPDRRHLFSVLLSSIEPDRLFPRPLTLHTDPRGSFVEVLRVGSGGQVSFSTTAEGVERGNHFHTRKLERFVVLRGRVEVALRPVGSDTVYRLLMSCDEPSYVDIPVWYTHSLRNVGDEELLMLFWISEPYDADDQDTYFETV